MTLRFSKKEIFILTLAVVLTAALIFAGFHFYLSPKKRDIETKTSTLKSEQQVLAALQQQQTQKTDITVESIAALQRKVPVKPQLEQLILDLEKAEIVSGSQIKNMTFAEADVAGAAPEVQQQQPAEDENIEESSDSNKESEGQVQLNAGENTQGTTQQSGTNGQPSGQPSQQTGSNQPAPYQPTPLPAGIKRLTVNLQVVSSNYDELKSFIETLEALPRTIVVESVGFSSGGEITSLDSELKEELSYSITLSAFYMPALTDLQDQLPEIVPPEPGNKTYPFNKFPDLPASELSN